MFKNKWKSKIYNTTIIQTDGSTYKSKSIQLKNGLKLDSDYLSNQNWKINKNSYKLYKK